MARSQRPNSSSARSVSSSSRYSSRSWRTRRSISSLALTWAQMSPSVWSGVRTLARRRRISVSSGCPSRTNFVSGMCTPSSNTSRASMARMRPPMSGMCEVVAEKATSRPPWKIGFTRHTSLRCPVPIQGLLVMRTSPGRIPSAPMSRRKWRTVAGSVPMNDGMLPVFWARAWPRASVSTQAKSLASLDSVENEVRTMALAASSTTEMRRVHRTSRVTASKRVVMRLSAQALKRRRSLNPRGRRCNVRSLPSIALLRWPLPLTSSTRMTSPAPMTRDSPSLAVICTPASRLMMYWRRGAGCQARS